MKLKSQLLTIGCSIAFSTGIANAEPAKPINNMKQIDEPLVLDTIIVKAQSSNIDQAFGAYLNRSKIARSRTSTSDTAQMFDHTAGVSFSGGGGISSRPVVHGMADDRVRIQIDGMNLISACGNHMNPALSYVAPSSVLSAQVLAGITPVSMGGDSIAGTIRVQSADPQFAEDGKDYLVTGQGSVFYRSNGDARGGNISTTLANKNVSLTYTGSTVESRNYKAGGNFTTKNKINGNNVVGSSAYKSENQSLSLAFRNDQHLAVIKVGQQNIPYQGFPNVRMDMTGDDSWFANVSTKSTFDWGKLETRAYHEDARHTMNFLVPDKGGNMPMDTHGVNQGLAVKGIIDLTKQHQLTVGSEYQRYRLDDWWDAVGTNPMMMMQGPAPFWNINKGQRDRLDFFAELESQWNSQWLTQFGVRGGLVEMNAGDVMDYGQLTPEAKLVNSQNKQHTDAIVDVTALARYTPTDTQQYELGFARKTRAPSLYERYAWSRGRTMGMGAMTMTMTMPMSMFMNNWYGDGNGYVGNNNLQPEVAYTVSGTANFHDADQEDWDVKVTPFYTYIDNYIDAGFCQAANGVTCNNTAAGFTTTSGGGGFRLLQLGNYNAQLMGVDASASKVLLKTDHYGSLSGRGILSYVRGQNLTSHDNLYQQMPLNSTLDLDYKWGGWTATLETQLVAPKATVQAIRLEPKTAGYTLLNLRSSYDWKYLRIDAGIENLLNKNYSLPLGGVYLGEKGASAGTPIPGYGRSFNVGLTVTY